VWQIPTKESNKVPATEMDFVRKLAYIFKLDKVRNIKIRKTVGVEVKPDIHAIEKLLYLYGHVH
jgi:hypothetical protein